MATEIVRTKDGEELPPTKLEKFGLAISTLEDLDERMAEIEKEAKTIEVTDPASFTRAGVLLAEMKDTTKSATSTISPYKDLLNRAKDFVLRQEKKVVNHGEQIRGILTPKMAWWTEKTERERKAEEDRVQREKQAELDREIETKRQADIAAAKELKERRIGEIRQDLKDKKITKRQAEKFLREAGADEEAAKAKAAADEEEAKAKVPDQVATSTVKSNVPSTPGVVKRKNFKFRIKNAQEVRVQYLCPDEIKIGGKVRECKTDEDMRRMEREIGGIEIYIERTF